MRRRPLKIDKNPLWPRAKRVAARATRVARERPDATTPGSTLAGAIARLDAWLAGVDVDPSELLRDAAAVHDIATDTFGGQPGQRFGNLHADAIACIGDLLLVAYLSDRSLPRAALDMLSDAEASLPET